MLLDDDAADRLVEQRNSNNSTYSIEAPDLSLNSWLQALPESVFTQPFESCQLCLAIHRLQKPSQEAGIWVDRILREPSVKPLIFPYTHISPSPTLPTTQSLLHSSTRPSLARSLLQGGSGRSQTLLGMVASSLNSRVGVSSGAVQSSCLILI